MEEDVNIIYIGQKPFMSYVTGVCVQFKDKAQDEVFVCARGKNISKAVDVSLFAIRTFLKELNIRVNDVRIESESFEDGNGRLQQVSSIKIKLNR